MLQLETENEVSRPAPRVSPERIFDTLNRYQHSMAFKGAIDLDLFTHIATGATTPAQIAPLCQASERGIRILCDFLTVLGFLQKSGTAYELTPESSFFLNKQSPAYAGTISNFLTSPASLARFRDVAALVRKGGTLDGAGTMEPENERWVEFARSMVPVVIMAAQMTAKAVSRPERKIKVLDVAAGHGMFGIQVALQNPAAEIFAVDWQPVLRIAMENANSASVLDRFHTIPGSIFEVDFGAGFDVVLIPDFLHHFDPPTNTGLLKRIRAAMNPGGCVATVEFVPNEDRVSPPVAASFSMIMLGNTEHGDAYTFREFDRMFREAGFGSSRTQLLEPTPMTLILTAT